jgi:endonuclease III
MHTHTALGEAFCSGSFELPYTASLSRLASPLSQQLVRPDRYDAQAAWCRLLNVDTAPVAIRVAENGIISWISPVLVETGQVRQKVERLLIPMPLPEDARRHLPEDLADSFASLSPLIHTASESLWEALVKGIIRQVITASQARQVLHRFITRFGKSYTYNGVPYHDFPEVEAILRSSIDDLRACELGFKAERILRLARILCDRDLETQVRSADPEDALKLLVALDGVGDWTARVAFCDLTANWFYHPCDLAVVTWARRLWATRQWPSRESEFHALWTQVNGVHYGIIIAYLFGLASLKNASEFVSPGPGSYHQRSLDLTW